LKVGFFDHSPRITVDRSLLAVDCGLSTVDKPHSVTSSLHHSTNIFYFYPMNKNRLEAFSDGVIAIIITIMVLEMKVPHGGNFSDLVPMFPVFISYIFSFVFIGIYWGNHHHLLHVVKKVSTGIILSNLNLLFWLSLVPFATAWMGENNFQSATVATYAVLLNLCGVAYTILQRVIMNCHELDEKMKDAMKKQARKGIISLGAYTLAIPMAWVHAGISGLLFLLVSIMWLIPDKNIERALKD
jgi:uncharacterized membrane protein